MAWRKEIIVAVGPDASVTRRWWTARIVEDAGRYTDPGVSDMHVHFDGPDLVRENEAFFPLRVAPGITTIRDRSGDLSEQVPTWRDAIARDGPFGPRLLISGADLEGPKPIWKGRVEVGTKADVDAGTSSIEHLDHAYETGVKDLAAIATDPAVGSIDTIGADRRIDAGFDPATAIRRLVAW